MDILDEHGIVNVTPISSYEITRLENHDPGNTKLVQFEINKTSKFSLSPSGIDFKSILSQ